VIAIKKDKKYFIGQRLVMAHYRQWKCQYITSGRSLSYRVIFLGLLPVFGINMVFGK
jgi:hypothetical protein